MTSPIIIGAKPDLSKDQADCVAVLKDALEVAESGEVDSLVIVVCMRSGFGHHIAGRRAADLNLGLDTVKAEIVETVRAGPKPERKRSSIVHARMT